MRSTSVAAVLLAILASMAATPASAQIDVGDVSVRNLDIDASSFRFKLGVSWWP